MENKLQWLKNNMIIVVVISALFIVSIFSFARATLFSNATTTPSILVSSVAQSQIVDKKVVVDVKGAVEKPGIYEVPNGSRVQEVIQLAGGLKESANSVHVNLAQVVHDEMVIVIPAKDESLENNLVGSINNKIVNINTASVDELMTLKGIGESKARAIVDYRQKNGLFKSIEELKNVKGISVKLIDQIKEEIRIR